MAAIKFSKQYIEPNPNEIDYWVDLSSNQYGGRMKYYNGFEWVDLVNPDGTHIDINDFYNKLQINQMLSQKASVDSVESKVDDDEVSDVIKNISFSQRGEDGVEMVMFKYDDTTVGIQLPIADNTKSGIITKDTFKNLVNQTQLQQLYSEMYTKLSEIRNNYQPKLRAGANIKIENNVISAVSKIGTDWNDIANKPDIYDKSQVDTMMSGVYKIKGSRRFEALPLYTNAVGDTYNITNDFSLHGEDYPMGTNVVWTENGWDALAGIFDTSELEEDIQEVKDNYLPLSGGTMTGKLVINRAGLDIVHDVNLYMSFKKSDGTYFGDIGFSNGLPSIWMPGKDWCKIWHEGNFNPNDYLSLNGGTKIPSNTDLNNYTTIGTYHCVSDSDSQTLLNCPITTAFTMTVYIPTGVPTAFVALRIEAYGLSSLYKRLLNVKNNTWTTWGIASPDFATYNAPSATKLATPVRLWGNDFDGTYGLSGNIIIQNDSAIQLKDTSSKIMPVLKMSLLDNLLIGSGTALNGHDTIMYGKTILFRYGTTGEETAIRILLNGNVGIGNDEPIYKLEVHSGMDNVMCISSTISSNEASIKYIGKDGKQWSVGKGVGASLDGFGFWSTTLGNSVMTLKSDGNVGIGTIDPQHKLDVNGYIKCELLLSNSMKILSKNNVDTMYIGDLVNVEGNQGGSILIYNDTPLRFYNNGKKTMTITGNNMVGIGTDVPLYKLDVTGTAAISGYTIIKDSMSVWRNLAVSNKIASGDLVDWYGVSWSEDSSDPTCTRIGNMALHRSLPIQSAMKGYGITNNDTLKELLIPLTDNWSGLKYQDDSNDISTNIHDLNIMIKIPEFWYCDDYEPSTKTHNLKISQTAKAGWCHHKEAYVGAYEGSMYDNYYGSLKNQIPVVSKTREQLRTAARANGYEDEYKWNIYTYEEHRAICHLFLVEYATRNSQAPVNTELTADGFRQGGLGPGCTTGSVKINGVDTYSFIPTGTTDSLGNGSGQVAYTVAQTDADGNELGTVTRYANRYRGIENPFGHIWKHVDDVINIYNSSLTYKTVYKCEKPEYFATNKNAKYKPLCSFPGGSKMQGWSKEIKATINCDFFKYSVGGSESTYWCDYNYDSDDISEHCLLIGGRSGYGGWAGLFYFGLDDGVGYSHVTIGSRLTYLPWAE